MQHECERCGEANPDDAAYCATCGRPLSSPDGVGALAGGAATDDEPVRTTEWVGAPLFGETGAPTTPPRANDDLPPAAPPAGEAGATALTWGSEPAPEPTAVVRPTSNDDLSGPHPVPVSEARSTGVMVAALAVAIVVIVGGVFVLLASGTGGDDSTRTVDGADNGDVSSVSVAPSTDPADVSLPSVTAAGQVEPTVAVVVVTDPPPPPAAQPSAPLTPAPTPSRGAGDLGLAQPILDEACDGRYITFVGSAVGAAPYADEVASLLERYPGSNYIWTKACPSLRQEFHDGNDIYGVVFGPYPTREEACDAVSFGPPDAYVRRISTTDPQDHTVNC